MSQEDHSRATWLDGFPRLRQGDRIATVQEKHRVFSGELLGHCAANPAARTGDEITSHVFLRKRRTSNAQRPTPSWKLRPPQRKPVVRCLPQTQANEPLPEAIIELRPKRANDIFSGRRRIAKILRFEIKMSISPWLKRFCHRVLQRHKVVERAAAHIVIASDSRFRQIPVTVTRWIVAFAIKVCVLGIGKRGCMQSMRRLKRRLQSEKNGFVPQSFSEKIGTLVQTNAVHRHRALYALVDVSRQTLGCGGTIL